MSASAPSSVAIIGGGPAGLMAADVLASAGIAVDVYEAMPSVGRKFLLAGVGGLNLTHSEPAAAFLGRYGARRDQVAPWLLAFGADAVRQWAAGLGIQTFVGSSGRVFPREMKAAPLLRAWLHRLRSQGVRFHVRHRWLGWHDDGTLRVEGPDGELRCQPQAVVLAVGGGSWSRFGSDGRWVPVLQAQGVDVAPLRPANCGFDCGWTDHFLSRFAGQPLKTVQALRVDDQPVQRRGECVVTRTGLEGSLIYALSAMLRDRVQQQGRATLYLDLLPDHDEGRVVAACSAPRGARSLGSHLQSTLGLRGVKAGLLWEVLPRELWQDATALAQAIKALPVPVLAPRPLDEAISTAGGVTFDTVDGRLMLRSRPGVFCAGEMLDWEAPTGGYLLTACLASGRVAGEGVVHWLRGQDLLPAG